MHLRIIPLIFLGLTAPTSVQACSPWVESHNAGAILRAHTDAFKECTIDEATYQRLVAEWLGARVPVAGKSVTLALGRAVTYPWLAQQMVATAADQPKSLQGSQLAKKVLHDPQLRQRLAKPFAGSGYELENLAYEKVLFGPADQHSSSPDAGSRRLPFDAQLWLQLNVLH